MYVPIYVYIYIFRQYTSLFVSIGLRVQLVKRLFLKDFYFICSIGMRFVFSEWIDSDFYLFQRYKHEIIWQLFWILSCAHLILLFFIFISFPFHKTPNILKFDFNSNFLL